MTDEDHIGLQKDDGMTNLLTQYVDWLRICDRSDRTINARRDILTRIDRELPEGLDRATADELRDWLYRDEFSKATKATYYGALKAFFVWATNPMDPKLDFDPTTLLPKTHHPKGLPRPVTDEELAYILANAAEPYLTWSKLAAFAGLRCCEIADLRREDIDERSILIRKGKGDKPGIVPTHPAIWAAVRDLDPGRIAYSARDGRVTAQYVSINAALHFRRQLNMPGVALHRLRHWFGTNTYRTTKDLRLTQELLRHSSPNSTIVYTLVSDEERATAVAALPIPTGARQA